VLLDVSLELLDGSEREKAEALRKRLLTEKPSKVDDRPVESPKRPKALLTLAVDDDAIEAIEGLLSCGGVEDLTVAWMWKALDDAIWSYHYEQSEKHYAGIDDLRAIIREYGGDTPVVLLDINLECFRSQQGEAEALRNKLLKG